MKAERFPRRHPLCTCPDGGMGATFRLDRPPPDRSQCGGGTIAHPPPLTVEQMNELISAWRATR